jgi:hypothetical protein
MYRGRVVNMSLLSRQEEMILLIIWKLQNEDGAHRVTFGSCIEKMTDIKWLYSPAGLFLS